MNERLVLAVDGGNSKTDVVLATGDGALKAHVRGPGSSPHELGVDGSLALLDQLIGAAWAQAGTTPGGKADIAEIYLAGADLPVELDTLREHVDAAAWAAESVVGNDALALLRAGTESPDAVAVVCGAGINCVGRAADGRVTGFPSLGQITGDWGGGRHLGYAALWHAARAEDGRGEATALRQAVPATYGRSTVAEVSEAMHLGDVPESTITALTAVLFDVDATGDPVAGRVVGRLADEIATLAKVTLRRLGLLGAAAPVVLGGGVVRAQHQRLVPLVRERLRAAPDADIVVVTAPPVLGAALFGLDALGATERANLRISDALRKPAPHVVTENLPPRRGHGWERP